MKVSYRKFLTHCLAIALTSYGGGAALAQNTTLTGNVVAYTTLNAQTVDTAIELARKHLPKLKFNSINGGSGQLLRRIESESAKPQADLFWTSSANVMNGFRNQFTPYQSAEAKAIPAHLKDKENLWIAANIHVIVGMVNTKQLAGGAAPKSWQDLLDPRFKGKIITADPNNSSTAFTALYGLEKSFGADFLKKLAKNLTVTSAASNVVRSVGQGEYAVGLTFESTAYPYVAGGQREIKILYPSDGTFVVADNMALVKNMPNPANAKAMYDLLLTKQAQIAMLENAFRRPSRNDIDVSQYADIPALKDIKVLPINELEAEADRAAFLKRWKEYTTSK